MAFIDRRELTKMKGGMYFLGGAPCGLGMAPN
jgi:hypothetical protein